MIIIKRFVSNLQSYTFHRNPPKHSQNFLIIKEKTSKNHSPPLHPALSVSPVSQKNQDPLTRILTLSLLKNSNRNYSAGQLPLSR